MLRLGNRFGGPSLGSVLGGFGTAETLPSSGFIAGSEA
jgi:hypothetical protein